MTGSPRHPSPTGYRLRVAGHLDQHWSPWFSGLTLTCADDGPGFRTVLFAEDDKPCGGKH